MIWFKVGVMIGTVQFYIVILVLLTLALVQGDRSVRKQQLLCLLSCKVFNRFEWNVVYC